MSQLAFNKRYFIIAIFLFIVEFLIGKYVHDNFVRPYVGDFLIVIFLYCLLKSFINIPVKAAVLTVLIISYIIEALQYLNFLDMIGLRDSTIANLVLGNYFTWSDILAYSLGAISTLILEFSPKTLPLKNSSLINSKPEA
ncbi:DUF2809 domain-containing protein [Desertivirga brevis]|uniref:ribosomal maturation YjgA family protein n=1 Tax=Desertivirga brevis TaxID=2810310 RepID=UPI001A9626C1|nr:DUF2809 domain-containing protein [Pedobacter sp. SYSU D00873]